MRSRAALPDLAYLVHEADNELLRYSLRSIAAHAEGTYRKVWIVGVLPSWITGVEHIPVDHAGEKFADIRAKLTALTSDRRVAANVVVMNDDHIALVRCRGMPPIWGRRRSSSRSKVGCGIRGGKRCAPRLSGWLPEATATFFAMPGMCR